MRDIGQLKPNFGQPSVGLVGRPLSGAAPQVVAPAETPSPEPKESFASSALAPADPISKERDESVVASPPAQREPSLSVLSQTWSEPHCEVTPSLSGTLVALEEPPRATQESASGTTLAAMLQGIAATLEEPHQAAMQQRETQYLERFPHADGPAAASKRRELSERYHHPTTAASSVSQTIAQHAQERGVALASPPPELQGALRSESLAMVKQAAQGVVDRLFLSELASHNPEKHEIVRRQTERFLDLAAEVAPAGFSAADAYRLVASNLALVSFQDKAAAENMLGDHGVRHLLGHNVKACEALADGLEKQGVPVGSKDRLVLHQAMIVHDLGYAMDSVRQPINRDGIRGQDAGHNVLAARYLRERSQDPEDPLSKLFSSSDLERMHRCVLFHDKDAEGGPGIDFQMTSTPTPEQRAQNLESMTRMADNSHAFEDKLPELLYRKPESLKAMRLMKTAGEVGDAATLGALKKELAGLIEQDASLARDDREALLTSVGSVGPQSYQFSVGRIAGNKPVFDITPEGKVELNVAESDIHQQTVALFGLPAYHQLEKFVKDCAGQKVTLHGGQERFDGPSVCVVVDGPQAGPSGAFQTQLHAKLLDDKPFVTFALLDAQMSTWQSMLESRQKLGESGLEADLQEVKAQRLAALESYRAGRNVS